jgi:hypothetical protein
MIDYDRILPLLADGNVEFIVVGGTAANIHGSARVTADLDILCRTRENIARLVAALAPFDGTMGRSGVDSTSLWRPRGATSICRERWRASEAGKTRFPDHSS